MPSDTTHLSSAEASATEGAERVARQQQQQVREARSRKKKPATWEWGLSVPCQEPCLPGESVTASLFLASCNNSCILLRYLCLHLP